MNEPGTLVHPADLPGAIADERFQLDPYPLYRTFRIGDDRGQRGGQEARVVAFEPWVSPASTQQFNEFRIRVFRDVVREQLA